MLHTKIQPANIEHQGTQQWCTTSMAGSPPTHFATLPQLFASSDIVLSVLPTTHPNLYPLTITYYKVYRFRILFLFHCSVSRSLAACLLHHPITHTIHNCRDPQLGPSIHKQTNTHQVNCLLCRTTRRQIISRKVVHCILCLV